MNIHGLFNEGLRSDSPTYLPARAVEHFSRRVNAYGLLKIALGVVSKRDILSIVERQEEVDIIRNDRDLWMFVQDLGQPTDFLFCPELATWIVRVSNHD